MKKGFVYGAIATAFLASGLLYYFSGTIGESGEYVIELQTEVRGGQGNERLVSFYHLINEVEGVDCNCGTLKAIHRYRLMHGNPQNCRGACKEAFGSAEKLCAMCDGVLCRYGLSEIEKTDAGAPAACDPFAVGCAPWPCTVGLGQRPEGLATDPLIDADGGVIDGG